MKKIIFLLTVCVFSFHLAALSQVRVGVLAGITVAKIEGRIHGDSKGGLMTSMVLDADLGRNFSFLPTLAYVQKGVTEPHPNGTLISKQYVALRYAEFTPNIVYHIGDPKGSSFFLGLGPSIDFNLPSKRVSIIDGSKTNADILFGSTPENDLRGVDYGVNVILGFRLAGGFVLTGNWNKGIRDLSPIGFSPKTKNSYIGLQIGYFFSNPKN